MKKPAGRNRSTKKLLREAEIILKHTRNLVAGAEHFISEAKAIITRPRPAQ